MSDPDWDALATPARKDGLAPVLSTGDFEGPLDWLVEQARARRIDLKRISVLALVEAFETALLEALAGRASATTLADWGDWLVLAAELTLLRSRLMLPTAADALSARNEAEALRRRLIERAEIATAAQWLGSRPQLGIEVFERGAPETPRGAGGGRTGDITALLRACLVQLDVPEDEADAFRVRVPFWSVADALDRMRRVLAGIGSGELGLEAFWPPIPAGASERERRCRAAVASTFVGGLELARDDVVTLLQTDGVGPIRIRAQAEGASFAAT